MKPTVAVIFGGKSVEHEISIISAIQAINAIDPEKYDVLPIYIAKNGDFYTGEKLRYMETFRAGNAQKSAVRVLLARQDGRGVAVKFPPQPLGKNIVAHFDILFPVVHGTNVEDGTLQGVLEYLDLPYIGPNVGASALGMDKWASKAVLKAAGLPVVDGVVFTRGEYFKNTENCRERLENTLGYPMIVKPVNLGSSIGIAKADAFDTLSAAIEEAFNYSTRILVEKCVQNLREINCAVLGDNDNAVASVCEEPLNATDILTFSDKYRSGGSKRNPKGGTKSVSGGMSSLSRQIPAEIPDDLAKYIQDLAVKAFKALGLAGVCRIDFLLSGDDVYINEVNTIPGSLSFYLWEASALSFSELCSHLISIAQKQHREKKATIFTFDTDVLSMQGGGKTTK